MDLGPPRIDLTMAIDVSSGASTHELATVLAAWTTVAALRLDHIETSLSVRPLHASELVTTAPPVTNQSPSPTLAWAHEVLGRAGRHGHQPIEVRDLDGRWTITMRPEVASVDVHLSAPDEYLGRARWQRALDHLEAATRSWLESPERPATALPNMGETERGRLVDLLTSADVPVDASVPAHELVERRAADPSIADAPAVSDANRSVTYRELVARSDRVGCWLQSHGLERGDRVGLLCQRGIDLVVGALAVLRAGGAYVALDPAYPPERIAHMLGDSGARMLLTDDLGYDTGPWEGDALLIPAVPASSTALEPVDVGPEDLAYVTYTSGSTGLPKGVMIEHASLCNLIAWHQRTFAVHARTRCALAASPAFDASIWELWPALAAGADLHVVDAQTKMLPDQLMRWITQQRIQQIILPTPLAESLLERGGLEASDLEVLIVGGDRLRARPAPRSGYRLVNCYGPAEVTVVTSAHDVVSHDIDPTLPPIGVAIDNTSLAVVDPSTLELVPSGVVGELLIGGIGLARGYIGAPDLTRERFIELDLGGGAQRYYRSGDLVRWRADHELDFIGRFDDQLKIRGCRIEPGEVEAALLRHPEILEAAVVATDGTLGLELCGIVVPRDPQTAPSKGELRRFLLRSLPQHMVPTSLVFADALPLTPNGKVDRAALSGSRQLAGANA